MKKMTIFELTSEYFRLSCELSQIVDKRVRLEKQAHIDNLKYMLNKKLLHERRDT